MRQVRAGRVVMSIDSTDLLNKRHLRESVRDGKWLTDYPDINESELGFGDIIVYRNGFSEQYREVWREAGDLNDNECGSEVMKPESGSESGKGSGVGVDVESSSLHSGQDYCRVEDTTIVIVTYGNGVPTSLEAVSRFYEGNALSSSHHLTPTPFSHPDSSLSSFISPTKYTEKEVITVIDCPCISALPDQLRKFLRSSPSLHSVIFADVCKLNAGMPLSMFAIKLQNEGMFFPKKNVTWIAVGGADTYNPLGNTVTFLNSDDVIEGINTVIDRKMI